MGLWLNRFGQDPKQAFKDLVYIGYCGLMKDSIIPKMARPRDILPVGEKSINQRLIFNCLVIGGSGSGKTTFLDSFISAQGQ